MPRTMPRSIQPPKVNLPARLPFEDVIDDALDRLSDALARNPLLQQAEQIRQRFPTVEEAEYATPLGRFTTPQLSLPELLPPVLDERKKEVIKAAIMDDLAGLIEKIPGIGIIAAPIADAVEDTAMRAIRENLTAEELNRFQGYDQVSPITTLAAIRTFARR